MRTRMRIGAGILALTLLLSGCGQPAATTATPSASTTVPASSAPAEEKPLISAPTDYLTDSHMALADRWAGSDERALAAVMKKAAAGENVTIAVIGGSITQGTISTGAKDKTVAKKQMYAEIFRQWWVKTFPDSEITFINAGIGATDSYLAVHRVRQDVLSHNPDLVLVEFSVNDSSAMSHKISYDNLLRTLLQSENAPAVLLLFLAQTNGATAQDIHALVGFNYQLPMLSYSSVMQELMDSGTYTAKDLSGDQVHPSALGHAMIGEMLWEYLNSIWQLSDTLDAPESFAFPVVTKEKYTGNAQILDRLTLSPTDPGSFAESTVFQQFPNSWTTKTGGEISFTLSFRNLGLLYYCQTNGKGGQFEVLVDGQKVQTLNADFSGGWGNYAATQECYTSDAAAEHTVTIRMASGSTGQEFTILGLLISE